MPKKKNTEDAPRDEVIQELTDFRQEIAELKNERSKLKLIEKELLLAKEIAEENETRFKALHNASFGGIAIHDKGLILDCNHGLSELSGYLVEELIGMNGLLLISEGKRDLVMSNILSGYQKPYEAVGLKKSGEEYPLRIEAKSIPYKGRQVRVVEFRDITDIKKSEDALRKSEEHFRKFYNNSLIGFFRSRISDGLFIEINNIGASILGLSPDEIIGKIHTADLYKNKDHRLELLKKLENEGEVHNYDVDYKLIDGREVTLSTSLKIYQEENYIEGVFLDNTKRKKTEEEKNKLEEQLIQAQKMEAIGTLAGGIAHDFNNILGVIMGYTGMALDDLSDLKVVIKYLNRVMSASDRAKDMVKQILAFSRKSDQIMGSVNIGKVIKETISFLRSSIPTTIEIKSDIEEGLGLVSGNATQINQVIMNLGTNAAHAMKDNGGLLTVNLKEVKLESEDSTILDLEPGIYQQLIISDTGCGMSKKLIERIFEPYFTTKKKGEGTGMGLSVIYGIINNHKGKINVYSEPEKGTVFNVYFPVLETVKIESINISHENIERGNNERVLFVDDEVFLAELGIQMLKTLGYRAENRTSSIEALEAFKSNPDKYDLIITDMTMPNMTGVQLAAEIQRIKPDFPIILCTGFSSNISEENFKNSGIRALVMKPVVKSQLAKIVKEVLEKKKS